ncbi:hypothetical protein CcaverHIS002_0111940 [Cutaneotrichosporon cavernicola]|uniref:Major facilitator superfamily (MFS) profile domain-containing protein n=1 Tax=Cutaneotrichosporon cavernicola TaxID=279322 RepID=A0AA48I604_9TREE|nr:uncharacterized protein CcaverHIS019_0111830 [Cutaneotrichosporon cavernicola]BEI80665.1 hypothetical protein CcaverHIS002_0111940 [Cutaneotrichosporon cavernicola]BEI88465.1 hypothetical protein CcaverHIS019_0111830 [Cutaneotrichosporon cavernicola]
MSLDKSLHSSPRRPSDGTLASIPNPQSHPVGDSTAVDLTALDDKIVKDVDDVVVPEDKSDDETSPTPPPVASQRMKWILLFIFSLAFFIDVLSYSAFFVLTRGIAVDLNISFEMQSWIITSYAVTFAAFLLFWGRVSDLYSATYVFTYGFLALGILNLIISFLPEKYSFLVIRALAGIAGAGLIPSSYRLIAHVFAPHELAKAYTLYGMTGGISNVMGVILAGFIEYIPNGGQMIAWRWFFRIVAIIVIPFSLLSLRLVPLQHGGLAAGSSRWKRLDVGGAFLALAAIIMLILGLTLGASHGWRTAGFLVPFLLSFILFPTFFVYEAYLGEERAMLPAKTWRLPNFALFIVFSLQIYPWWGVNFLGLIETWMSIYHERAIVAAVRTLPEGLVALVISALLTMVPILVARPRWTVATGQLFGVVGYILMTRPTSLVGKDYWRFIFPGMLLGSAGNMAAFIGTNVAIMTSVPAEMSGVTGAVLQVGLQLGATIGFATQAGLLTVNEGGLSNPENLRASFYFQLGWCALFLIMFLVFYRPSKAQAASTADAAEQARPMAH